MTAPKAVSDAAFQRLASDQVPTVRSDASGPALTADEAASAPTALPAEGAVIEGWTLLRCLGAGELGATYLARDADGAEQAWKILAPAIAADAATAAAFERGVAAAIPLAHPNLLAPLAVGRAGGYLRATRPYVNGWHLGEHLARKGRLAPKEAVGLLRRLLSALVSAHDADLLHGDLKPEDVLLSRRGEVLLIDLAQPGAPAPKGRPAPVAVPAHPPPGATPSVARGSGGPPYRAPELREGLPGDRRVDLYALGVLAFRMLAGTLPYEGDESALRRGRDESHPDKAPDAADPSASAGQALAARCPDLPAGLTALVNELLARDRAQRPKAAHFVLDRLEALIEGELAPLFGKAPKAAAPRLDNPHKATAQALVQTTEAARLADLADLATEFDERHYAPMKPGRCPHCEHDNHKSSRFCDTCGAVLYEHCPYCSASVRVGVRFCEGCAGNIPAARLVHDYLAAAQRRLQTDDLSAARVILEAVVAAMPTHEEARARCAETARKDDIWQAGSAAAQRAYEAGDFAAAEEALRGLLRLRPRLRSLKRRFHEVRAKAAEQALEAERDAIRRRVDDGRPEEALHALEAFRRAHPDLAHQPFEEELRGRLTRWHLDAARAERASGDTAAALAELDKALHYHEGHAEATALRRTLRERARSEGARARRRRRIWFAVKTVLVLGVLGGGGGAVWVYRARLHAWARDLAQEAVRPEKSDTPPADRSAPPAGREPSPADNVPPAPGRATPADENGG